MTVQVYAHAQLPIILSGLQEARFFEIIALKSFLSAEMTF